MAWDAAGFKKPAAEELIHPSDFRIGPFDQRLVAEAQDREVRLASQPLLDPLQVRRVGGEDRLARGRLPAQPAQHSLLRVEHLREVALHEDDAVSLRRRQVEE